MGAGFLEAARQLGLDREHGEDLQRVCRTLAAWLRARHQAGRTLLAGINGAQGSGKSTLCALLKRLLREECGLEAVHLSIDDFYRTGEERERMARELHPLFRTRGVPGTHDAALALEVVRQLQAGEAACWPQFDKGVDDRCEVAQWPRHSGPVDLILFEGWCVGAVPQPEELLLAPVNRLEAEKDRDRIWRTRVNEHLADGPYRELFERFDALVMLRVPDFEAVARWRWQQEEELHAKRGTGIGIASREKLDEFLMHYERLTRYMLEEMPGRANVVCELDDRHRFRRLAFAEPDA